MILQLSPSTSRACARLHRKCCTKVVNCDRNFVGAPLMKTRANRDLRRKRPKLSVQRDRPLKFISAWKLIIMSEFRASRAVLKENVSDREKRPRGSSPIGVTPRTKEKRPAGGSKEIVKARRHLTFISTADVWSDVEQSTLVELILLHKPSSSWPTDNNMSSWDAAATFVHTRSNSSKLRTGTCE